jgi:hypothetical protein
LGLSDIGKNQTLTIANADRAERWDNSDHCKKQSFLQWSSVDL